MSSRLGEYETWLLGQHDDVGVAAFEDSLTSR